MRPKNNTLRVRVLWFLISTVLLSSAQVASAGIINGYNMVYVSGLPVTISDKYHPNLTAENTVSGSSLYGSYSISHGTARAGLIPTSMLGVSTSIYAESHFGYGFPAGMISAAGYRDFVAPLTVSVPDVLRFKFQIDGAIGLSWTPDQGYSSSLLPSAAIYVDKYANSQFEFEGYSTPGGTPFFSLAGYQSTTFSIDVPFDTRTGGYRVATIVSARADPVSGQGISVANADFSHTIQLTGLELTDGTSLDPANFRFESGLNLVAVPEPCSMIIYSLGAIPICLVRGLRRRGCH